MASHLPELDEVPMAKSSAKKSVVPPEQDHISPDKLNFDPDNPRFIDSEFEDEIDIIRELYEQVDVDELIQTILSAGYIDFEPLIVLRTGNVVLEGNRRLAALRLIEDSSLRKKLQINLPKISDPKPLPETVRVFWVDDRLEARSYIGFKHINGPFKWDALAKAKYAATWYESGGDIGTISRTLGDNHNTVRRLVNGWFALQQAINDGFDLAQISKKNFSFSHLYTALTRASVRDFLNISSEDLTAPPKPDPISSENADKLQQLMSWLYGQEEKDEPTIIQSQNPNLNQLSKVLGHPEAKIMLIANRNLKIAFERVEPASARFEESLMNAAKQCEDVLGLSGAYDGDPTLMFVAGGLQRTTRTLVTAMKERLEKKSDDE